MLTNQPGGTMFGFIKTIKNAIGDTLGLSPKAKLIEFLNTELSISQRLAVASKMKAVYHTRYKRSYAGGSYTKEAKIKVRIFDARIYREGNQYFGQYYGNLIVESDSEKEKCFKYNNQAVYNEFGSLLSGTPFESSGLVNGFNKSSLNLEYIVDLTELNSETIKQADEILKSIRSNSEVLSKWQKLVESI